MRAKGITSVILSGSDRVELLKISSFLETSQEKGIPVQMLLGDNSWLEKSKQTALMVWLEQLLERTGHLHIDVEPHTLADFKLRRRAYLDAYHQLIGSIHQHIGNQGQLSVSVPLHWDSQDYKKLNETVDHIYLMAYEMARIEPLERRLAKVLPHLSPEKVVVALRPEDFQHKVELESVIEQLITKLGVTRFALHDLDSYLELSDGQ
jgi:hypothetical protein